MESIRNLAYDAIVDGANFAGGQFSYFNNQAIGLRGVNLTNPGSFLPERFIGQATGPYPWIPFGGGVRRCLAASCRPYSDGFLRRWPCWPGPYSRLL